MIVFPRGSWTLGRLGLLIRLSSSSSYFSGKLPLQRQSFSREFSGGPKLLEEPSLPESIREQVGVTSQPVPLRAGAASKRAIIRRRIGVVQGIPTTEMPLATVVAACTAQAYDIPKSNRFLQDSYPQVSRIQADVIHVKLTLNSTELSAAEAFIFGDGCIVLWGVATDVSSLLLRFKDSLGPFEIGSLPECETETLFFKTNRSGRFSARMDGETIILEVAENEPEQNIVKAKLAFSNGLADSVKLAVLENSLDEHIERVKPIPLTLAKGGKLPVGRAKVLQLTGELLKFRADLNLHSELTEIPEMYWTEPELEQHYRSVARVLDIRQRAHVLNKRLDYANELAAVLRSHLSEQHGLKLEWGIIALIAVEVAFETLHWIVEMSK